MCLALGGPAAAAPAASPAPEPARAPSAPAATPPNLAVIRAARDALRSIAPPFVRRSWARQHPEELGQSFDVYARAVPRPEPSLTTIYIQPLGEFSPAEREILDQTMDALGRLFARPVKILPALSLSLIPPFARRTHPQWGDRQVLAPYLLFKVLVPRRPPDALAVLGLTTMDLWPGRGWNFVFGQASLSARVGVYSLHRYGKAAGGSGERRRFLLRTLKIALHETGHMLGIEHCTAFACGMNGTNSLDETDANPLAFCPECAAKVWWATGQRRAEGLASLTDFAARHGLADEARSWSRQAERVRSSSALVAAPRN